MANRKPAIWCADLVVPVSPTEPQAQATAEGDGPAAANEIWDGAAATVRLAGAANEVLAFQLVVEKRAGRVESIDLDAAGLVGGLFLNVPVAQGERVCDDVLVPLAFGPVDDAVAAITRKAPRFTGRGRWTFTVELYIPPGTPAGGRDLALTVRAGGAAHRVNVALKVYAFELPAAATCTADLNNYSVVPGAGVEEQDLDYAASIKLTEAYFRLARDHRALFHLLPYSQAGRITGRYAPLLAGRGRDRRVVDFEPFDTFWGGLLDGSAFAGSRGGEHPIEYLYLPVNGNWPATFEKYPSPGYWHEYRQVISQIARHLSERGWRGTKFEVFFNHKARWKFFPWDMDEIRFDRDNYATADYGRAALEAAAVAPDAQIINRIDSSWIFDRTAFEPWAKDIGLWVVNRGSHSEAPDASAHVRKLGGAVWFYGGAGPIAAADRLDNLRWSWIAWGREADGFCWWNGIGFGSWEKVGPGTGHCIYPGQRFGIDGPLPSIRLKVLHRGQQDHAYLTVLTQRTGSRASADAILGQTIGASGREDWYQRGEGVEAGGADILAGSSTGKAWNTAGREVWANARARLAEAIEKA
ncbi:MAG: hypothetical protein BIFFINMI_03646 [Phycisphaerae bacterium]|nr:hypothetical protein [Phycisphaerae bacterium]